MKKTDLSKYHKVGKISEEIADAVEFKFTGSVYAAPGVIKHIRKRHKKGKDALSPEVIDDILETIKRIIASPDYLGKHPKKIGTSIELIKKIDDNILVAIEVDLNNDYIYVSSLYPISESKIVNRLNNGRFIKYSDESLQEAAAALSN